MEEWELTVRNKLHELSKLELIDWILSKSNDYDGLVDEFLEDEIIEDWKKRGIID